MDFSEKFDGSLHREIYSLSFALAAAWIDRE